MKPQLKSFLITKEFIVKLAMKRMVEIGQKTLFIIDGKDRLIGALSDGDIRKWILGGGSINSSINQIFNKKPKYVKEKHRLEDIKKLMLDIQIEAVPVVKTSKEIVNVLTWEEVFGAELKKKKAPMDIQVVIMAGGKGSRLDPFTKILPKPLIPIGDKPVIEVIMDKFLEYGIKGFIISVNHKAKMIKSYFEDSDGRFNIRYLEEKKPLGTAGALRFLKGKIKEPFLITNCDIIINADINEIVKLHVDKGYDMTLVVSCRHYVIPYGVCEIENGGILKHINEKPDYDLLVNTGMYIMDKKILNIIPRNKYFDMNDLISSANEKGFKVGVFPIAEDSWIDIGQWEEYRKAVENLSVDRG